jgi:hypothetical protein
MDKVYELGAAKKFTPEQVFDKGYKLMILRAILTLCAMNIGEMIFKHGHMASFLMMESYILRVKAVYVECIGKYKDERAYRYWMSRFVV